MLSPWSWLAEITVEELAEALLGAVRWRLRERVLGPFGEDSAEVGLRAALGDAGDPPAGESCRSMELVLLNRLKLPHTMDQTD